ncbi:pseudouridine synthase [Penaeicola halotolerans]|uniref:pseudouridine synthase n=1 Tax=Penaeicola halotolerans TaxID=2793196 RepID=UPI001CF82CF4|nr:pseudouridine synthase [Penaeicola halotolerans]
MSLRYFLIYKPFNTVTQFSGEPPTLKELADFPPDVYPVGRLDKDSEGLLLITNDKQLNHALLNPRFRHEKTYYAQVEGIPDAEAIRQLEAGVTITVDGKPYQTLPATVRLLAEEPELPPRNPPIRYRAQIPTAWLEIKIVEGKNRQVRKMTAAVGYPTLRLVRWQFEGLTAAGFDSGAVRELSQQEVYTACRIPARSEEISSKPRFSQQKKQFPKLKSKK